MAYRRTYESETVGVHWSSERRIHTGRCRQAPPAVFGVRRRPRIDADAADADAIADAIAPRDHLAAKSNAAFTPSPRVQEPKKLA
jgi:uncharacterized Fe-S cluster protein YjdI